MFKFIPVHERYGIEATGKTIKEALDSAFDPQRWYWDVGTRTNPEGFRFGFLDDQIVTAPKFNGRRIVPVTQGDQVIGRLENAD